jgi:outer membrane receptor protein involved in Fe transport
MRLKRLADQDLSFLAVQAFGVALPWSFDERSNGTLFTEEVRLQSRGKSPFQWLAGAFYLRQKADAGQFVADYSCPTCLPQVLAGQDFAYSFPLSPFSDQKQRSVFGEVSYDFTSRWTAGVGGRYLRDELTAMGGAQEGLLAGGSVPPQPIVTGTKTEFNPSAYLRFKPTSSTTMYAQAARGFRSGQVNQLLPDTCTAEAQAAGFQQLSDPDTLWNYELGLKARFADGRYSLHSAVFRQKWSGVQLIQTLTCGFSGIVNGGDVTGRGAEVEFTAQPTDAWLFNVALAYSRNRFQNVATGTSYANGERVPDAPENNGSVGAQYNFHLSGAWGAFARADFIHVGNVLTTFGASDIVKQDSFNSLNLRLGFSRDELAAELYGRNITDERGVLTTNNNTPFGANQTLTRPREVGIELRYSFR